MDAIEQRTADFYAWEIRGRGWRQFPYCVELAPPFEPFVRRATSAPISRDDARKLSPLERARRWFMSPSKSETDEPRGLVATSSEPDAVTGSASFVEWDLLLPIEDAPDTVAVVRWLRGLAGGREPIAFEVIAARSEVLLRVSADMSDVARVVQQTATLLPSVVLRPSVSPTWDLWNDSSIEDLGLIEFALAREFMLPLNDLKESGDFFAAILAATSHLSESGFGMLQVMFQGSATRWSEHALAAVTTPDGDPFIADAPEISAAARLKCAEPLVAVAVRVLVGADRTTIVEDVLLDIASALQQLGTTTGNAFTPLVPQDFGDALDDVFDRTSHRHGFLLSLPELAAIVDLPPTWLQSERVERFPTRTRAAPSSSLGHEFSIGMNDHQFASRDVGLSVEDRLKHCYIIGASGSGKSNLLLNMARQDIRDGNGFGVLDPHGDLIDSIMASIPDERTNDVLVLDPSDRERPVGLNILSANDDDERTLLASDLVGVFRRMSDSFGDQMEAVLANAILAFLHRPEGGTLLDLREFLIDKAFRERCLETVTDPETVKYWRREFPLLRGTPQSAILTRLNAFLRNRPVRDLVATAQSRVDLRAMMNDRKIFSQNFLKGRLEKTIHIFLDLSLSQSSYKLRVAVNGPQRMRAFHFFFTSMSFKIS